MIPLLLASLAWGDIVVDPPPRPGEETMITVTDANGDAVIGAYVHARRSPGLTSQTESTIGTTDARGRVPWVPAAGGLVHLNAGGKQDRLVNVDYLEPPLDSAVLTGIIAISAVAALFVGLVPARRRRESGT